MTSKPDIYRSCASIVLFRPAEVCTPGGECGKIFQVLLLHKPRKRDAWQLPQGGAEEGETTEQAAMRELHEEAGIDSAMVTVLGKSNTVYLYDFPASYRRFRRDNICGQRIEFVLATVDPSVQVKVDDHEIDGHVWVLPEEFRHYITRPEYLKIAESLVAEGMNLIGSS